MIGAPSKREARRIAELREYLRTFDVGADARGPRGRDHESSGTTSLWDEAVAAMHELVGMEQAALFFFRTDGDSVGVERLHITGATRPADEVQRITDEHFRKTRVWALYDPKNPEAAQQNTPMIVVPPSTTTTQRGRMRVADAARLGLGQAELEQRLIAFDHTDRTMLKPIGWSGRAQLRALVCDGGQLIAWLGGMAEGFTEKQEARLGELVPMFLERMRVERSLLAGAVAVAGFDAAFQAIEAPAFLLRESGAVMHMNAAGHGALAEPGMAERLADAVAGRATLEGLSITPLLSRGSPPHFLAVVRRPPHVREKVARAIELWSLTPREGEVLYELSLGRSNKEISRRLGCAESTVEVHVTRLLGKADCTSRLELVARLWRSL